MVDYGLIKHLRTVLLQDSVHSKKISGVFTTVPPDVPYPYVTLSIQQSRAHLRQACLSLTVKVWSAYHGLKEIQELAQSIQNRLEMPYLLMKIRDTSASVRLKLSNQQMDTDAQGIHCLSFNYEALIRLKREGN